MKEITVVELLQTHATFVQSEFDLVRSVEGERHNQIMH